MGWALLFILVGMGSPAEAAISFVKSSTQGSCGSAASCSSSFGTLPSAGNTVFVIVSCWNGSADCNVSSITDNQGNTYTKTCVTDTAGNSQICIGYDFVIGSPSGTFTVTANAAASTAYELIALEYAPLASVDVTKSDIYPASSTADTGVSASTAVANELSICATAVSAGDTNINITTPTGYTRRGVQQDASTTIGLEVSTKVLSATGTQQCQWTHDTVAFSGWAAVLMTFQESSSSVGIFKRRTMQ